MIEVRHVTKKYGDFTALNDVNFVVNDQEIVGFLGPNGAGKTTTMNIITGFIEPTAGNVIVNNYDIGRNPKKAKSFIGYMPESVPLYQDLTVKEFVKYMAELKGLKGLKKRAEVEKVIEETGLESVKNKLIRHISRGFRQRAGLAGALIGNPDVLILDEPTVGLDPKQITEIRKLIMSLGKKHTVILSSHILSEVSQICSRVIIINDGKIIADDSPEKLESVTADKNGVYVVVEDPKDNMKLLKKTYKKISEVKLIKKGTDGTKSYQIIGTDGFDVRKAVLEFLPKHEINIFELKKIENSLEDAFLSLVKDKDDEKVKEEIKKAKAEKAREEKLMNMSVSERDKALREEFEKEKEEKKKAFEEQLKREKKIEKEEKQRHRELKDIHKEDKKRAKMAALQAREEKRKLKNEVKELNEKRIIEKIKKQEEDKSATNKETKAKGTSGVSAQKAKTTSKKTNKTTSTAKNKTGSSSSKSKKKGGKK